MTFENLTTNQKIRAILHRDIRGMSTETCHLLGLDISKSAIELIFELVLKKLSMYGSDLEAFAKHAKRVTINSDDVKLLVRRNPSLKIHLNSLSCATTNPLQNKEKRKTTSLPSASNKSPVSLKSALAESEHLENPRPQEPTKSKESISESNSVINEEDMDIDLDTVDLTFE